MKIKKIEANPSLFGVYDVTLVPNWFEKFFGVKEQVFQVKDKGATYMFGGGAVYIDREGNELGNGHWIAEAVDKHRRKW